MQLPVWDVSMRLASEHFPPVHLLPRDVCALKKKSPQSILDRRVHFGGIEMPLVCCFIKMQECWGISPKLKLCRSETQVQVGKRKKTAETFCAGYNVSDLGSHICFTPYFSQYLPIRLCPHPAK